MNELKEPRLAVVVRGFSRKTEANRGAGQVSDSHDVVCGCFTLDNLFGSSGKIFVRRLYALEAATCGRWHLVRTEQSAYPPWASYLWTRFGGELWVLLLNEHGGSTHTQRC